MFVTKVITGDRWETADLAFSGLRVLAKIPEQTSIEFKRRRRARLRLKTQHRLNGLLRLWSMYARNKVVACRRPAAARSFAKNSTAFRAGLSIGVNAIAVLVAILAAVLIAEWVHQPLVCRQVAYFSFRSLTKFPIDTSDDAE